MQAKTVLITGCAGMIGSLLINNLLSETNWNIVGLDIKESPLQNERFKSYAVDLSDSDALHRIFNENNIDRVIHLAALAHTKGVKDTSLEAFLHINVDCAENIFKVASNNDIPILFISTVDVLGFVKGNINANTIPNPVSNYGKSKAIAEQRLKEISNSFDIYRFSPVYTKDVKRDIQKRYYLKEPNIAYKVGAGGKFEVLDVNNAIKEMKEWLESKPTQQIRIIKDDALLDVNDLINQEKKEGRANLVLRFPRWSVVLGYYALRILTGKSNKSYLVFKALWPFRS